MPDFSTPASHAFDPPTFPSDSLPSTSTSTSTPTLSLFERYSIPQTLSYLNDEHPEYKTIALQFPDELLGDSVLVYRGLMKGLKQPGGAGVKGKGRERQCYVLGDSTYGSCCPDVLSSLHLPADVLIHYGHACLTRTESLPVLYVFPKRSLIPSLAAEKLYSAAFPPSSSTDTAAADDDDDDDDEGERERKRKRENVVVVWDVGYDWLKDEIKSHFLSSPSRPPHLSSSNIFFSEIDTSQAGSSLRSSNATQAQAGRNGNGGGCCSSGSGDAVGGGCCRTEAEEKTDCGAGGCGCSNGRIGGSAEPRGGVDGVTAEVGNVKLENGEIQQPGLENVGGAQVDLTSHSQAGPPVEPTSEGSSGKGQSAVSGSLRTYNFPEGVGMKDCVIFYIGEEGRGMINLAMENSMNEMYQFDPSTSTISPLHSRTPRLLLKRLHTLHRLHLTSTIGILVHNVGLRSSHKIVKDLRKLIRDRGRKSYTVSVGRVRPEKLGNFEVVGGWVLVGCREGGLVESKDYLAPIVTPHELRLALQGEAGEWRPQEWTLDLGRVLNAIESDRAPDADNENFRDPLGNAKGNDEDENDDDDDERPVFSLADGSYHMTRRFNRKSDKKAIEERKEKELGEGSEALIVRSKEGGLIRRDESRVAASYLATRTYQGLDASEGYDANGVLAPSTLVDGRVGVARGYKVDGIGGEGREKKQGE